MFFAFCSGVWSIWWSVNLLFSAHSRCYTVFINKIYMLRSSNYRKENEWRMENGVAMYDISFRAVKFVRIDSTFYSIIGAVKSSNWCLADLRCHLKKNKHFIIIQTRSARTESNGIRTRPHTTLHENKISTHKKPNRTKTVRNVMLGEKREEETLSLFDIRFSFIYSHLFIEWEWNRIVQHRIVCTSFSPIQSLSMVRGHMRTHSIFHFRRISIFSLKSVQIIPSRKKHALERRTECVAYERRRRKWSCKKYWCTHEYVYVIRYTCTLLTPSFVQ